MEKLDFKVMVEEYNYQMNGWRGRKLGVFECACQTEEEMFRHCRGVCRTVKEMEVILGIGNETIKRQLSRYGITYEDKNIASNYNRNEKGLEE